MSNELKPCPFCGATPELPDGEGTQYEIECGGCGQAMASVQICDLMTLEERAVDSFSNHRYAEKFVGRAKAAAIENWNRRAQPAEADGVVELGSDAWMALHLLDRVVVGVEEEPRLEQVEDIVRRMGAALSAVTAERDQLRHSQQVLMQSRNARRDERDQLRAEVEGIRKDAERYRWLRGACEEDVWDATNIIEPRFNGFGGPSTEERQRTGKAMDHFIDAALAAKEG